jgi:tetratricopeptide (TPR) repeat protein
MRHFHGGARNLVQVLALPRATRFARLGGFGVRRRVPRTYFFIARFLLPAISCAVFISPACSQDNGSEVNEFHGKGAEITVTVHDRSGELLSSTALVTLFQSGASLSRQGETSRGSALFVVNNLGDFTLTVEAPGYERAQKEVTVDVNGRTQVDIYLHRFADSAGTVGVPGKPLLAPKAKEALEKSLRALSADKIKDAETHVSEAMRLAPAHPDVLYVEGVLYLRQRKWPQAQSALEKATQMDPNHAQAFAALGMALCDQGKFDAAIEPLEKSLQLDPAGTWETRWTLAKAYYQSARYDEALKMSQEALTGAGEKAPEISLLVAQSLTAVGRYEDAAKALRAFLLQHGNQREAATARKWLERLTASGKIRAD